MGHKMTEKGADDAERKDEKGNSPIPAEKNGSENKNTGEKHINGNIPGKLAFRSNDILKIEDVFFFAFAGELQRYFDNGSLELKCVSTEQDEKRGENDEDKLHLLYSKKNGELEGEDVFGESKFRVFWRFFELRKSISSLSGFSSIEA